MTHATALATAARIDTRARIALLPTAALREVATVLQGNRAAVKRTACRLATGHPLRAAIDAHADATEALLSLILTTYAATGAP